MKTTEKPTDIIRLLAATAILYAFSTIGALEPAGAQPARGLSCGRLWYQRNAIYARAGHCFNTERGRATFGEGCFSPYGRLSGAESRQVQRIQRLERMNGC
ncbi:YARHG domain-containing protein [Methylosinus sp. Ce-a6]|uniref:YARHG domain-containing protein n=1 Tax=Methylosinus sp. Ce-a6 TaxID=2172005 RepID=UPI0013568C71|nr:YARHG domain-containing protein [Methylosinus sp. Ce-a6]